MPCDLNAVTVAGPTAANLLRANARASLSHGVEAFKYMIHAIRTGKGYPLKRMYIRQNRVKIGGIFNGRRSE